MKVVFTIFIVLVFAIIIMGLFLQYLTKEVTRLKEEKRALRNRVSHLSKQVAFLENQDAIGDLVKTQIKS